MAMGMQCCKEDVWGYAPGLTETLGPAILRVGFLATTAEGLGPV
jgi:hypothetical protein